jgi:hypothetical protein
MSNFDSTKLGLGTILDQIMAGKIQLPDFQRGWIWDDQHIRALLVSIARAFPVGSIMLLETGGDVRFQIRAVEGIELPTNGHSAERLILDGQQRLTSLIQALKMTKPVKTQVNRRDVERYYYIDIECALEGSGSIEEAIIGVDAQRTVRSNFGRDIDLDLSSPEKEYEAFYFPCNQILDSDDWEVGLMEHYPERFARYMQFRMSVLKVFRDYQVPIIELKKENTKEAVCLVFEKVNTGGVPLSAFELITASFAADGFNLRDDWYGNRDRDMQGRKTRFAARRLLADTGPTDFLQGVTLLYTYAHRRADLEAGLTGREVTAVSAKREHMLALPLEAYRTWADALEKGFFLADQFLRREGFHHPNYLPYRSQLVPLATVMTLIGDRWMEPVIYDKLARWYWCGVLGELYGSAVETRIALDLQEVLAWIDEPGAAEPTTVIAAGFQASRLDTLRTRTSAAYRGLYVLLQRFGARDFFWKTRMVDLDRDEYSIDIHHIFPRAWCRQKGIPERVFNAIVNKTPISYKANRKIGGSSPSYYLEQLRNDPQVQMARDDQDAILKTHLIDPALLRANDFDGFYQARKQALIVLIEKAMGKAVVQSSEAPAEDSDEDE